MTLCKTNDYGDQLHLHPSRSHSSIMTRHVFFVTNSRALAKREISSFGKISQFTVLCVQSLKTSGFAKSFSRWMRIRTPTQTSKTVNLHRNSRHTQIYHIHLQTYLHTRTRIRLHMKMPLVPYIRNTHPHSTNGSINHTHIYARCTHLPRTQDQL